MTGRGQGCQWGQTAYDEVSLRNPGRGRKGGRPAPKPGDQGVTLMLIPDLVGPPLLSSACRRSPPEPGWGHSCLSFPPSLSSRTICQHAQAVPTLCILSSTPSSSPGNQANWRQPAGPKLQVVASPWALWLKKAT